MSRMNSASRTVSNLPSGGSGLDWREIYLRVKELRKKFIHLFVKTPTDVTFRQLSPDLIRCYFLLSLGQGREYTLFYADINLDPSSSINRITYTEVLECNNSFLWRRTSKEEQLLFERRRISTWGITNYELHPSTGTLVFPAASTIFQCVHPEKPNGPVNLHELSLGLVCLNPQICPSNSNLIAFSAKYDIYIYNIQTGQEKRVTYTHSGSGYLEYDPKSAGVPSYVMQEEFSRYKGYWWQPVSPDGIYRLLYEEVDESKVPIVQFISPDDGSGMLDEFRFPRAGMSNAESKLKLLEIEISGTEEMKIKTHHLAHDLKVLAPWYEYLTHVGWTPDGAHIWCELLDRRQQRLELVLLSPSAFTDSQSKKNSPNYSFMPSLDIPPQTLLRLCSSTWIDVHNMLYWFKNHLDPMQRMFIFASEETGYRHLYMYLVQLHLSSGTNKYDASHYEAQGLPCVQLLQKIALTSGEWCVLTNGLWVDEKNGLVYFVGVKDTPLEHHLYVTSISKPGVIQRLTPINFSHQVFLNEDCTIFVSVFSNIETPPQSQVFRIDCAPSNSDYIVCVTYLGDLINEPLSETLLEVKSLVVPEVVATSILSGEKLYSMVFKPHNYVPGKKYPTVLHIYGGPQVQLVSNTFKGFRYMRAHMLAAHGFCVISIDSRGSENRGVDFQAHIMKRMGTVEVEDQLEVLKQLALKFDFIDFSRLGVFGWSYGGYLSLMALAQRPEYFKLAIAGAPVVSWNLYDTGYTERYMDLPSSNPSGYKFGSVLNYISNFPDQENRLLIVQGMMDENVHFSHTNQLIQALIKAGKPYQLQIYPRERHCLRQLDANEHYEAKLLSFLLNNL